MPLSRATAVALLAVTAGLAGCGGGHSTPKRSGGTPAGRAAGAIEVWSLEKEPERVKATRAIVAGFTRKTGIRVKLVPVDEDQLPALVAKARAARALPDVLDLPLA